MARQSRLAQLATVPLFSACSKKELQAVGRAADELRVPAGRQLFAEGDLGREVVVITEGTADVRRNGRKVATLGPGDSVGELSLLDRGPRTATVTASTDMSLLVLGSREFSDLLVEVPSIAHNLLKAMAIRMRALDSKANL